jgi:hypothetical protein
MNGQSSSAVSDAIVVSQNATLTPDIIVMQGAGKAYQSVAQSMAIAVQDATDSLRNTTTMATTAMGVALAQFLATKDAEYLQAIDKATGIVTSAAGTLATVGKNATDILKNFPTSN